MNSSRLPSSRLSRFVQYGGLAANIGLSALGESFRRATTKDSAADGSPYLNSSSMDKIVRTLSRMRGAALKIAQMLSLQGYFLVNSVLF